MSEYTYTLKELPDDVKSVLLSSRHLENVSEHRNEVLNKNFFKKDNTADSLFDLMDDSDLSESKSLSPVEVFDTTVIWGTDNYESKGDEYGFVQPVHDLSVIIPRVDKSKEEQKRRVKEKAEVFTPSWVCNEQNNLVDDHILGKGAFNTVSDDKRTWFPSKSPVKFPKGYSWLDYVVERRIEFTCGEGPYLMSIYDPTTGDGIPVRDDKGLYQRIGLLDRKLRVVTENVISKKNMTALSKGILSAEEVDELRDKWISYAFLALSSTFGYEWQGDNLLLARLNFVNTFIEYYADVFGGVPEHDVIVDVAEIASWNLWQMDGLKMVEPLSCSDACKACKQKKRAGHDGRVSVMRFLTQDGFVIKAFEDLLPSDSFAKS